jgi:hypothetical protein
LNKVHGAESPQLRVVEFRTFLFVCRNQFNQVFVVVGASQLNAEAKDTIFIGHLSITYTHRSEPREIMLNTFPWAYIDHCDPNYCFAYSRSDSSHPRDQVQPNEHCSEGSKLFIT